MRALWRIYLYSRYGVEEEVGVIVAEAGQLPAISKNYKGKDVDGQPSTVSADIIRRLNNVDEI